MKSLLPNTAVFGGGVLGSDWIVRAQNSSMGDLVTESQLNEILGDDGNFRRWASLEEVTGAGPQ